MKRIMLALLLAMTLSLMSAARAGTIVWDFDGTDTLTTGLPGGAIDGDMLVVEGWRRNPTQVNVGLSAGNFQVANGFLTQTYNELPTGAVPTTVSTNIHCTGVIVGDLRGTYAPSVPPTVLNLANCQTEYPYLMLGGRFGWSSAGGNVGLIIYNVTTEAAAWFTNSLRISTVQTNTWGRQVFNLTTAIRTGTYTGTLRGLMFDFYGMWNAAGDPTFMLNKWISEFNPTDVKVELEWVALTNDPDFRSSYVPVELASFGSE